MPKQPATREEGLKEQARKYLTQVLMCISTYEQQLDVLR